MNDASKASALWELCVHRPKKDAVSNDNDSIFFVSLCLTFSITIALILAGSKQTRLSCFSVLLPALFFFFFKEA